MSDRFVINPPLLTDIPHQQAEDKPNELAMSFEGDHWTYAELDRWCNQFANGFSSLGVKPGDRIIWLARNLASFWPAFFGAAKMGAVLAPLNWRLAPAEVMQILEVANARLIIAQPDLSEPLNHQALPQILAIDDEQHSDALEAIVEEQSGLQPDYQPAPADPVLQLYTSGTTGLPKGVVLTHRCFQAVAEDQMSVGAIKPTFDNEIILHTLPHFHIAGVTLGFMGWRQSMPLVQYRQFDVDEIFDLATQDRPINAFLVPAMISMLVEKARAKQITLDNFACISYGAAPMPERLLLDALEFMPKASFWQFYGMTEATGGVSVLEAEDHLTPGPQKTSAGKPLPGCELRILNVETGKEVSKGEVGEVVVKSDYIMHSYWNNPTATEDAIQHGWYRTGDAGYLDDKGFLYLIDRIKDMIISGGENIYPAELENHLSKHPKVLECAVVGKPDERWGEVAVVFASLRDDSQLDLEEINAYLGDKIASFKLPKDVQIVDALPRNPSGKVLKTDLRARMG